MKDRLIVVHSKEHVYDALDVAHELRAPVILQSYENAVFSVGIPYLKSIQLSAVKRFDDVSFTFIFDCQDDSGAVLAALRQGCTHIRFSGKPEAFKKLSDIAEAQKATLINRPFESLDLLYHQDPRLMCRAWLKPLAVRAA